MCEDDTKSVEVTQDSELLEASSAEVEINKAEKAEKERGASLIEYALLVALIAVIALAAVRGVGQRVSQRFSGISVSLDTAEAG